MHIVVRYKLSLPCSPTAGIGTVEYMYNDVLDQSVNVLANCIVPSHFKDCPGIPLLKKTGSEYYVLKKYRPVSSLLSISKVLERIAHSKLFNHLTINNQRDKFQSTY